MALSSAVNVNTQLNIPGLASNSSPASNDEFVFYNNVSNANQSVTTANLGNTVLGNSLTQVASATTCNIGAAATRYVEITGTTTITAFDTACPVGTERLVWFAGILTLTNNASSLILPGGANITTAAGDTAYFKCETTGNWRCLHYQPANGKSVVATTGCTFNYAISNAAGTTQATAGPVGANTFVSFSNVSPGVNCSAVLPIPVVGSAIFLKNISSNSIGVFPASSCSIDYLNINSNANIGPFGTVGYLGATTTNSSTFAMRDPIYCEYNGNSGQTVTAATTDIIYTTLVKDTHSCYNISNGKFTAQRTGPHTVTAGFIATTTPGSANTPSLYKNGTLQYYFASEGGALAENATCGTLQIWLNAGDYITIRSTDSLTISSGNAAFNFFNVMCP